MGEERRRKLRQEAEEKVTPIHPPSLLQRLIAKIDKWASSDE